MPYQKELIVSKDDLDELDHVNNVRYVQWIQDISKEHWKAKAPQNLKNSFLWVVLSHFIEYKAPALLNDPIVLSTFIQGSNGAKSTRIVEMHHKETNVLLVRSSTEWCLLHNDSLKPIRIPSQVQELFK